MRRARRSGLLLPAATLWQRETVRFLRQRNRVAGALGTPLLFWILLGSGYGSSFQSPGGNAGYLAYFFPGSLVLTLFFTAIYSTISIIEDRREGFLQAVLVAPIPRAAIILGKVLGGATVALIQALLFLLLAPTAGIPITVASFAATTASLALIALGLTGLGVILAWRMESTQGFHAVMNLVLMPMWMLSGALFPIAGAAGWMGWVMRFNPLTYGVASVRSALGLPAPGLPAPAVTLAITAVFGLLTFAAATLLAGRRPSAVQP